MIGKVVLQLLIFIPPFYLTHPLFLSIMSNKKEKGIGTGSTCIHQTPMITLVIEINRRKDKRKEGMEMSVY